MSKPWGPIAVGSFAAAYYIFWSSSWQDGIDSPRETTRVRPSAPQITVPAPVPAGKTAEQKAAEEAARQEAARQEAARQEAARQEAARQEAARQEAVRQEAARQEAARQEAAKQEAAKQEAARKAAEQKAAVAAAAASAAAQAAYAAKEMARIKELKKGYAAAREAANAKRRAEAIEAARIQNEKARAAHEAAMAAAAPQVQTNYLITLQNPIEASILIGNLQKTAMMNIFEPRTKKMVLSTGPWGNNIIPKSSNNDGYIDGLDLLKLPIKPNQVAKVNRKMVEAGMDEYGSGYKLAFTDNKGNNLIMIELGSPTSVTDFPVDRANSQIKDIGRNIRYSAKVVSYN